MIAHILSSNSGLSLILMFFVLCQSFPDFSCTNSFNLFNKHLRKTYYIGGSEGF